MELQFDHIIHYIQNIESLNFPGNKLKIIDGGKHERLGTMNRLSYLDLSYIELIDIFDKALVEKASLDKVERLSFASSLARTNYQEGFVRMCFRTDDIVQLKNHFNELGLKTIGPLKMDRVDEKGKRLSWELLYIDEAYHFELPFFIQWNESDTERKQKLQPYMQPMRFQTIIIEAHDFDAVAEVFVSWLGYEVVGGVINTYFLLKKAGLPNIKIIPGNMTRITKVEIKTQDAQLKGAHLVHDGIYEFI